RKSLSDLRNSVGNSQIRFRIPKAEWEFPNPFPNSENRLGTPKSLSELRNSIGNSEMRFGSPKFDWELANPFPISEIRLELPKSSSEFRKPNGNSQIRFQESAPCQKKSPLPLSRERSCPSLPHFSGEAGLIVVCCSCCCCCVRYDQRSPYRCRSEHA